MVLYLVCFLLQKLRYEPVIQGMYAEQLLYIEYAMEMATINLSCMHELKFCHEDKKKQHVRMQLCVAFVAISI